MTEFNDDWELQKAYEDEPKKAFHIILSHLFQPAKLSKLMITSITTQSDLQEELSKQINRSRKQFWQNLICSRYGFFVAFICIVVALKITHPSWYAMIKDFIPK